MHSKQLVLSCLGRALSVQIYKNLGGSRCSGINNTSGFLAFSNLSFELSGLLKRKPVWTPASLFIRYYPQKNHVHTTVFLAGNKVSGKMGLPALHPGRDPLFKLGDDRLCDFVIDRHDFL